MPTYSCFSRTDWLSASRKQAIAQAITRAHAEITGAPAHYAQVLFVDVPDGNHFIGGAPLAHDHLFVSGHIRAGRSHELRAALIKRLSADVAAVAELESSGVWVYLLELPAAAMVEFGQILPEPGHEAQWNPALPSTVTAVMATGSPKVADLASPSPVSTIAPDASSLLEKLPLPFERHQLAVPPRVAAGLDRITARIRHQQQVLDDWGFRRRAPISPGVPVLFAGPTGTGKTMAAQILARELGQHLYRVDLSRVVSKYIGETEKNLQRVFEAAERDAAILLFDEADALFGKRSDVKDSHDRYASFEVGCLLQRIEAHDGITILAANRRENLDDAFLRRLRFIVEFPAPTESERRRIWAAVFPPSAARSADVDFDVLARDYELSGGEIANAALAAAFIAAAQGAPIGMRHVKTAIHDEIARAGRAPAGRASKRETRKGRPRDG
jgi:phenylpyruvate tautomerase PptA (4-oxalocrotonate tautomerase family)